MRRRVDHCYPPAQWSAAAAASVAHRLHHAAPLCQMLSRFTLVALVACAALSIAVHAADTTDVRNAQAHSRSAPRAAALRLDSRCPSVLSL